MRPWGTAIAVAFVLSACAAEPESLSVIESESTVASHVNTACSTSVVIGLSKQIADEISCVNPTGLVRFAPTGNLKVTSNAVLPYLSASGKSALEKVAQTRVVQVNSAFRTVVQQYLLYQWYRAGRCGITAAAQPGASNHESGRALDLANYSQLISAMGAQGWSHDIPGDPVHFDHRASPDIRGRDIAAFQRLWNRNHPNDTIAADGVYGPQTENRLRQAPAEGFPLGPTCIGTRDADVVRIVGPDRALPETRVHYAITVKNTGTTTWPATTTLRLAAGTSSPLHDASWLSASVITKLDASVAPTKTIVIDLDVMTPAASEELPVFEELVLDDAGKKFGEIQIALTVAPGLVDEESGEGHADSDDHDEASGGCSSGGGGSAALSAFLVAAMGLRVRRRRSR
ncbi:MAG: D-alanyl-D-alanine carboxypeptidase family protein [Deltaproteobacteria bacterium]|nr:D-alanyl-D-alanine carboxypeptidase family protein [Deltaproteobacteria bacterium]